MISRPTHVQQVQVALRRAPIVALLGARQCGKTTLASVMAREHGATTFDLESPQDLSPSPRERIQRIANLLLDGGESHTAAPAMPMRAICRPPPDTPYRAQYLTFSGPQVFPSPTPGYSLHYIATCGNISL